MFISKKSPFVKFRRSYRYFLSLGRNCEPAIRFRDNYGWLDTTVFSYCAFMEPLKLPFVLQHLNDIFKGKITHQKDVNMWTCGILRVAFHGRHKPEELTTLEQKKADCEECQSRVFHLVDKFQKILEKKDKKLFVMTVWETTEQAWGMVLENVRVLRQKTTNFDIVVVVSEKENRNKWHEDKNYPELYIRSLAFFSPFNKVVDPKFSDQIGWKKIWKEFSIIS